MAAKVTKKRKTRPVKRPERALARLEKALDAANAALAELKRAVYPPSATPPASPTERPLEEKMPELNYPKPGAL